MCSDGSGFLKNGNGKVFLFFFFLTFSYFWLQFPSGSLQRMEWGEKWKQEVEFSHGSAHKQGGVRGHVSSHWSDLAFFGPAPFISGDETGLFAAGLAAEPSLLVSCSHLTCVAGP